MAQLVWSREVVGWPTARFLVQNVSCRALRPTGLVVYTHFSHKYADHFRHAQSGCGVQRGKRPKHEKVYAADVHFSTPQECFITRINWIRFTETQVPCMNIQTSTLAANPLSPRVRKTLSLVRHQPVAKPCYAYAAPGRCGAPHSQSGTQRGKPFAQ